MIFILVSKIKTALIKKTILYWYERIFGISDCGNLRNFRAKNILFHVEHHVYRPIKTNSTLMSEGETPLILDACEIVTGRIASSFSLAS